MDTSEEFEAGIAVCGFCDGIGHQPNDCPQMDRVRDRL